MQWLPAVREFLVLFYKLHCTQRLQLCWVNTVLDERSSWEAERRRTRFHGRENGAQLKQNIDAGGTFQPT